MANKISILPTLCLLYISASAPSQAPEPECLGTSLVQKDTLQRSTNKLKNIIGATATFTLGVLPATIALGALGFLGVVKASKNIVTDTSHDYKEVNVFISPEGITHQDTTLLWSDIARIHIQQTDTSSFTLGMLNRTINQRGFVHTSFSITITPHEGAPWHVVAKKDPTESLYQTCPEAQNIIDKSVKEETQLL